MSDWITISNWVITVIYVIAFVGTWGYIITITGNMLDASKEDVEGWKKGLRGTGLKHYLYSLRIKSDVFKSLKFEGE